MSKQTRRATASIHAITHGKEAAKALPDIIPLTRSQSLSLAALANDEQRLMQQAQQIQQAIQATQAARVEVLAEIGETAGVDAAAIAASYVMNGQELVKASKE